MNIPLSQRKKNNVTKTMATYIQKSVLPNTKDKHYTEDFKFFIYRGVDEDLFRHNNYTHPQTTVTENLWYSKRQKMIWKHWNIIIVIIIEGGGKMLIIVERIRSAWHHFILRTLWGLTVNVHYELVRQVLVLPSWICQLPRVTLRVQSRIQS